MNDTGHRTELFKVVSTLRDIHERAFAEWMRELTREITSEQADEIAAALKAEMRGPGYAALLAVVEELEESAEYWSEYFVPLGIVDRMRAALTEARGC